MPKISPRIFIIGASALWLLSGWTSIRAQTTNEFRTRPNQIVVSAQSHWEDWGFPAGTLEISPRGAVRPRRWNRNTDATEDIVDFLRFQLEASQRDPTLFKIPQRLQGKEVAEISLRDAVVAAGSNPAGVVNVLDGDPTTFWEPAPLPAGVDPAGVDVGALWWFTVDLGRLVFLKKIELKFVDEDLGDPFLLYDVLVSDGRKPIAAQSGNAPPEFFPVLISLKPNKTQRSVEVDLRGITGRRELGGEQDEFLAEQIQFEDLAEESGATTDMATLAGRFVQVVIRGSDLNRGRQIAKAEFEQLAPADTGAVEYYKKLPDGGQLQVSRQVYFDRLEEEKRGDIRYYIRERPRLAELNVWVEGDDIFHGTLRRGGIISSPDPRNGAILLDGDVDSAHFLDLYRDPKFNLGPIGTVTFDLGSFFWLDAQRMTYTFIDNDAHTFGNYTLEVSDGSREPDGSLKWSITVDRRQTETLGGLIGKITEGNNFDPVVGRFFKIQWNVQPIAARILTALSEFQLFGAGFQPQVELTSERIPLGNSKNLLSIEWDADTPPGTKIELQTRTGDTFSPDTLYYHGDNIRLYEGGAVEYYTRKNRRDKGNKIGIWVDGPEWEKSFSAPYANAAGSPITSPSPRQFVRIRATLFSNEPEVHATLKEIRLNFAAPVARHLLGEVTPTQVDSLGVQRPFSVYIRPDTVSAGGFDQLLLAAPPQMRLTYRGLYGGKGSDFSPAADLASLEIEDVDVRSDRSDSLHLTFPAVLSESDIELFRLDFATALFTVSAPLRAALRRGDDGWWQRVDAGDAAAQVTDNDLTLVALPRRKEIFRNLAIEPQVFTPNGDDINDAVRFIFDVVLIRQDSAVEIHIHDLGGRRVRSISARRPVVTGAHALEWDGRDHAGNLVAPGVYVVLLKIDANTEGAGLDARDLARTVAVAY